MFKHPPWPPLACVTRKNNCAKPAIFFPAHSAKRAWFEHVKVRKPLQDAQKYLCACAYLHAWREHPPFTNPGNATESCSHSLLFPLLELLGLFLLLSGTCSESAEIMTLLEVHIHLLQHGLASLSVRFGKGLPSPAHPCFGVRWM